MKQRINTVKEEWKKLLTFGALGWVKSSQIWGKMGSTSPLTRHERGGARPNEMVGLGKKECLAYAGQVSAGWWL